MSKLNAAKTRKGSVRGASPITTTATRTRTHEGAPAYVRDVKSELFLLGVSNFVGEETFYESADARDARYAHLVQQAALEYPEWTAGFLAWLRNEGNMRHAPIVGAAHFVKARLDAGVPAFPGGSNRSVIASVLARADEPGDLIAYWLNTFGRRIPKPVKRGVADAVGRLYTEYALLKYDSAGKAVRFGDVIELTHPSGATPQQGHLFRYALDRRRDPSPASASELRMVRAQASWREWAASFNDLKGLLDPSVLKEAGLTWEDVLSALGSKVDKGDLWSALIPSMGYMATLRNLRNFDEAIISPEAVKLVQQRLSDPAEVARSRQFPYRFLAAYEQVNSVRWADPLDQAMTAAVANVPAELADSLILVDTSASMTSAGFSRKSKMTPAKAAAVFGVALAMKGADLFGFADGQFRHAIPRGSSLVKEVQRFVARTGEVGHGTRIGDAVRARFLPARHKRIFIISDEQTMDDASGDIGVGWMSGRATVPAEVPVYAFNLGGYRPSIVPPAPNRVSLGGLTDATFKMVPLIEAGRAAQWPWLR